MGSIRARKDTGALFFDFIYQNTRCRELTTLKDTPENRRTMEKMLKKIEAEILLGQFEYTSYFPSSSMARKLASDAAAQDSAHQSTPSTPAFQEVAKDWLEMIRKAIKPDGAVIHEITANSGFFSAEEVDCVAELWDEYLVKGSEVSGYYFIVLVDEGTVLGFACYGPRALTRGTYDLYWIAVDQRKKHKGTGREINEAVGTG